MKINQMKSTLLISLLTLVVFFAVSCSNDYLDINTDPNNPTSVIPSLVLPVAQSYSARIQEDYYGQNKLGNYMMYTWSQSSGYVFITTEFVYNVTPLFYDEIYNDTYSKALKQYNALLSYEGDAYGYYHAIAIIMKCYHFQLMVDTYGDVPYFESLKRSKNPTPVYDDAQTIYLDLISELTNAINVINELSENSEIEAVLPMNDDAMFGGDMNLWKSFANAVKLRILVRMSDLSGQQAFIKTAFDEINSEGSGFMDRDVTVQLGYINEQTKMNPKWERFGKDVQGNNTIYNDATCATQYIIELLTATSDPRIDYIYEEPVSGHLGVEQGVIAEDFVPENVSNLGPGILRSPSQAAILYTLAECYFNQAEAVLKGLMAGDAKTLYEQGIQASFRYLGAGDASNYYSQNLNLVGWEASMNKLETIITQKWIATNSIDALQSWFDYSRTGYPLNLPVSTLATTPDRPVRLAYPSSELSTNGLNVPNQPDVFNDKIFWAK